MQHTLHSINFDTTPSTPETPTNNMMTTQILQEIYKIQDSITELISSINTNNSSVISVLADKLTTASTKKPEAVLMETFANKFLENPEQMIKFAEIANKFSTK